MNLLNKHLGFSLNLLAIALFIPGILLPMFSLAMEVNAQVANASLTSELINKEVSLVQTVQELWHGERFLVAILIFLFSICIPLVKSSLMSWAYFQKNTHVEKKIYNFVSVIGKWSMADVFVVAVFLAMLSTNHSETANRTALELFGFKMDLVISSETLSAVGVGFYYFTAYCLLSLLASQISQASIVKSSGNID
ncbi:paraquat-inducible protein A [Colwellia asteriadis]|uniref:Paraquat-inducible protein A n=1 Tax=Colwellia asteriadis TaxID=517723 RepID=A0ABP3WHF1_9GAMM